MSRDVVPVDRLSLRRNNQRQPMRRQHELHNGEEGSIIHHPRIANIANMTEFLVYYATIQSPHRTAPFSKSATNNNWSWLTSIYAWILGPRKRRIDDEMLHHDGWTEEGRNNNDANGDDTSKGGGQEEAGDEQCVPMAGWQTTSYPNCNVGECTGMQCT